MRIRNRMSIATMTLAMVAVGPLAALAANGPDGAEVEPDRAAVTVRAQSREQLAPAPEEALPIRERVEATERNQIRVTRGDEAANRPSDRPVVDTAGCDRARDAETDCPVPPVDHECLATVDNPQRCVDVPGHDLNVRHLIWRLINAHEWSLLHRLLHWLGV